MIGLVIGTISLFISVAFQNAFAEVSIKNDQILSYDLYKHGGRYGTVSIRDF